MNGASGNARSSSRVAHSPQELYSLVIGRSSQAHYLRRFAQFDRQGGTSPGWHGPAFFCTFCWLLYRKSWLQAAIYAPLPGAALAAAVALAVVPGSRPVAGAVLGAALLPMLLLPWYADAAYYRLCRKRIAATLRMRATDPETMRRLLMRRGGTSRLALLLLLLLLLALLTIAALAVVAPR